MTLTSARTTVVFPSAHRRGGVERIAWDYCHHLAEAQHPVTFVGRDIDPSHDPRIDVNTVLARPARGPLAAPSFRLAAQRIVAAASGTVLTLGADCPPGDVYYVQSVHRSWLGSARTIPMAGRSVPAKIRFAMPHHLTLLAMEARYFRSARPRAILCTSSREVNDLQRFYGVRPEILHVVPNGFDPRVFNVERRHLDRDAARRRMGVRDGEVVLLLMANELHRKGFGPLLRAVSSVADESVRIDVVGRTDLSAYRDEIARLGLMRRVHWHGATDDAAFYYAGADLLTLPTQYEPFGLVIVEALATGLPVITTRRAGAADAVRPGVNGLLQEDPYDVEELTSLLRTGLDPAQRAQWSRAAPDSVDRFRHEQTFAAVDAHVRP